MGRGHGPGIGTATWTNSTWPARTPLTTPTLPHPLTHFRAAVLDEYVEDLLSGPEPYTPGPYTGDDNDDPGFYSDYDFDDDAPY